MKTMMTRKVSMVLGSVCLVAGAVFAAATPALAGPPDCPSDLDGSGAVDVKDLLILIGDWGSCPAPAGVTFYTDQGQFDAAIEAAGILLKGFETYPWSAAPGGVIGVDDPLNINTSVPGWIKPGILLDNVQYQSNLDPFGANGPNPRGGTGLALFTTGFIGATHNGLNANHFVDSFDILSGPPAGDNHTAMAMQVASFNNSPGGSAVVVSVYDKDDNLIGQTAPFSAPANQGGAFLGFILISPGEANTIGRVNIYDTNPGFNAEGLYTLGVYVGPFK